MAGGTGKDVCAPVDTLPAAAIRTQHSKNSRSSIYCLQEFRKLAFKCRDAVIEMSTDCDKDDIIEHVCKIINTEQCLLLFAVLITYFMSHDG